MLKKKLEVIVTTYLSVGVNSQESVGVLVSAGGKNCLSADAVHVHGLSGGKIKKVEITKLSDHVDSAKLFTRLQSNWEVPSGLSREEEIGNNTLKISFRSNFQDVQLQEMNKIIIIINYNN